MKAIITKMSTLHVLLITLLLSVGCGSTTNDIEVSAVEIAQASKNAARAQIANKHINKNKEDKQEVIDDKVETLAKRNTPVVHKIETKSSTSLVNTQEQKVVVNTQSVSPFVSTKDGQEPLLTSTKKQNIVAQAQASEENKILLPSAKGLSTRATASRSTKQNLATDGPLFYVEQPFYDFGSIVAGDKVSYSFIINNKGNSPLIIHDAILSCACTTVALPERPITPGESDVLKVFFDSAGKEGTQNKTVILKTNDAQNSTIYLYIKGQVRPQ